MNVSARGLGKQSIPFKKLLAGYVGREGEDVPASESSQRCILVVEEDQRPSYPRQMVD